MVSRPARGWEVAQSLAQLLVLIWPGTSPPSSKEPSLGLQLKHCEDPVVIDDGDSPPDQTETAVEPHSDLAKSQDTQPIALAQSLGFKQALRPAHEGTQVRLPMGVGEEAFVPGPVHLEVALDILVLSCPPGEALRPFRSLVLPRTIQ